MPMGSDGNNYGTDGSIYGYQPSPNFGQRLGSFMQQRQQQQSMQGPQYVAPQGVDPSGSVLGSMPQQPEQGSSNLVGKGLGILKLFGL